MKAQNNSEIPYEIQTIDQRATEQSTFITNNGRYIIIKDNNQNIKFFVVQNLYTLRYLLADNNKKSMLHLPFELQCAYFEYRLIRLIVSCEMFKIIIFCTICACTVIVKTFFLHSIYKVLAFEFQKG